MEILYLTPLFDGKICLYLAGVGQRVELDKKVLKFHSDITNTLNIECIHVC